MHTRTPLLTYSLCLFCVLSSPLILPDSTGALVAEEVSVKDCRLSFVNRTTYSTQRPGVVAYVPREGAIIDATKVVVKLQDEVAAANLKLAEARASTDIEIQSARKSALAAAAEYDAAVEANRISSASNPVYPSTHMTRLRLDAEAAQLQVEKARYEQHLNLLAAEQARAELGTYHVYAKDKGLVTRVFKRIGEGVQQGESIVQVVNTETMRIEGFVDVEAVEKVRVGMPVRVTFQVPGSNSMKASKPYTGQLGFVDVSVQNLSRNVRVWAEVSNPDGLLREGLDPTMAILIDEDAQPQKSQSE
ncbi:efflux RND transporter periplasmic adaptor subunit [Thalassoglobus neptunius]|nr:efflux RND transporter periplasmic adaptor subunit [Thalassoglobus neptunius]